jgi:nucleoside 2-deoxyribosyltransferase
VAQLSEVPNLEVFASWYAAGPNADDCWKSFEQDRGLGYIQALQDWAAQHVFKFDQYHLERSDAALLVLPAGRSGHLELGYTLGRGKPGYILLDDTDTRWDVMYNFATKVYPSTEPLKEDLTRFANPV